MLPIPTAKLLFNAMIFAYIVVTVSLVGYFRSTEVGLTLSLGLIPVWLIRKNKISNLEKHLRVFEANIPGVPLWNSYFDFQQWKDSNAPLVVQIHAAKGKSVYCHTKKVCQQTALQFREFTDTLNYLGFPVKDIR